MYARGERDEKYETHDEVIQFPDKHPIKRHPRVHPHDVLDDLHDAPMHSARRSTTQNRIACRRMRHNRASAGLPQYTRMSVPAAGCGELALPAIGQEGGRCLRTMRPYTGSSAKSLIWTPRSSTTSLVLPATLLGSQDPTSRRAALNSSNAFANSPHH